MTSSRLVAILERLQRLIDPVADPKIHVLMADLFNEIEAVIAENAALRREIQDLRDEVNHLKGEQGQPTIRPNTPQTGNVSSERERRHAERDEAADASTIGFKLDTPSSEKLKEHRIPDAVLDQLAGLHGTRYPDEAAFLQAVESAMGSELTAQYRDLLVRHTRYRKRCRPAKVPNITIDREEICVVERASLPADATWKG